MSAAEPSTIECPHRLVRASAGSGKTFQLTNQYLRLLLAGEAPGDLLATTFTRAAAGEILHRALARLADAVVDEAALDEMRAHVDPSLTQQRAAEALQRAVDSLHRLSVMTIDAFFARLAGSFSLELGLAPGWRLLDDNEDDRVKAAAVDRALRDAHQNELYELLRDLQGDNVRMHAHQAVMQAVEQAYDAHLATLRDDSPWRAIEPIGETLDRESLSQARRALSEMEIPTTKAGAPRKNWSNALDAMDRAIDANDWEGFARLTLVSRIASGQTEFDRAPIEHSHRAALAPLIEHARRALTNEHARRTRAARALLERFDAAYTEAKRSLGAVTFHDPPRLLFEAETTGELTHLFFRLDARLRHVLLDEFQDTSLTQFRLLEPILDELLSQTDDGRSVFCVGDIKQSLYAWRQAEPTLLPALADRWPALRAESLSKSWRSSPAALDAVNATFSDLRDNAALRSSEAAHNAATQWDADFEEHIAAKPDLPGAASLTVTDETDQQDAARSTKYANRAALETCADRVAEARRRAPNATIAVLVRRGEDLRAVLGMLKRRGVDASERRGNPLVDAPPVAAAVSMLRAIDHPGHTAALHHVASAPLGEIIGLTDASDGSAARRLAARLRRRIVRRGCADLLAEWFIAGAEKMDARGAARFEQFIDLAESFDQSQRGGPAELADLAETQRIDEPGAAPVRAMTIHGAKGLEFDAVFLPLISSMTWRVDHQSVITARDHPLGNITCVSRYPNETLRSLHPDLDKLHAEALQKQVREELCCLYVAATRAKRRLDMIVPADQAGRKGDAITPDDWRLRPDHVARASLAPDAPATPGATLWEKSTEIAWFEGIQDRSVAKREQTVETVSLRTRAPSRRSASRLASAAASQADESERISAASLLTPSDRKARRIGDLIHHWFEQIKWIDRGEPDDAALLDAATRRGFDPQQARDALPIFRRAVNSEPIRDALTESSWLAAAPDIEQARVHRERAFAVRDAHERGDYLLQGRFDRLVIGLTGGRAMRAQVIDFKTDQAAADLTDATLRDYAERHRAQVEAYRRAASRLFNLPQRAVITTLIFTAAGRTTTLPPKETAPGGAHQ